MTAKEKPIDGVTVQNLGMALRMVDIQLSDAILDKTIDLVELIEDKGDEVSLRDISNLQTIWARGRFNQDDNEKKV